MEENENNFDESVPEALNTVEEKDTVKEDISNKQSDKKEPVGKKKIIWSVVFVLIAAGSIYAVVSQSKNFSLGNFFSFIGNANPLWLSCAVISMLGFIVFEALAISRAFKIFGCKTKFFNNIIYSSADIYFSAITPSATGGQPASAYFMIKDGVSSTVSTVSLIVNLQMYTLSIITIGVVTIITHPQMFLHFGTLSRALIIAGIVAQIGLLLFFIMILKKSTWIRKICAVFIRLLAKVRIIRNPDKAYEKLNNFMNEYENCAKVILSNIKGMIPVFIFNLLQRASQIAVTAFTFLATSGKTVGEAFDVFAVQNYVVLATNCLPIPGAMGITDYVMLDAFQNMMSAEEAVNLELLSRSLSFYLCIILCGILVLSKILIPKLRGKKHDRNL